MPLKRQRKKCLWKCNLLQSSAAYIDLWRPKYRDKQCGPNRHNKCRLQTRWTQIRPDEKPGIRPTKSRAWSGSKLSDTFMEIMKSADDTLRYSITAFCHVCHLYTRAISALKFCGAWVAEAGWSGPGDVRALVSVLWCSLCFQRIPF